MDSSNSVFSFNGIRVAAGETREIYLNISESFLSASIQIPVTIICGRNSGPIVFVVAAIHGDEINGADIVRRLIFDVNHDELIGTLIAVPIVNIPGFLAQSRYLPYHRDLNRFFPGNRNGNNAERFAHTIFKKIVKNCDYGIDLHTAASGRSNLPHVRGDMRHPKVRRLARAFGATVLMDQPGVKGSLRKEATEGGVPTILFEAGETGRFSQKVSLVGLRGVLNVLSDLGMLPHRRESRPPFQVIVKASQWIRAERGGVLDLVVKPGDLIYEGDRIGSLFNPFGKTVFQVKATSTGIVIGQTTAPLAIPGSPLVHVARLKKTLPMVERSIKRNQRKKRKKTSNK